MIPGWARRAVVGAWARRLGALLSHGASGFRSAELDGETVRVSFSSYVDPAVAFPLFARGVQVLPPERIADAYRIGPPFRQKLIELGFATSAPVRSGDELAMIGEGRVAGYVAGLLVAASRFSEGFPAVEVQLSVDIPFVDELHDDVFFLCAAVIRRGEQLGEFLEGEDAATALVAGPEFAALHGLWGRWNEFFVAMVASRTSPRRDFHEHVQLGHDISLAEVMEAVANQIADPVPESRPDKHRQLGDRAMRRTAVLGITDGGRVIEVVLESQGGETVIVTAYPPDSDARIAWWLKRAKSSSSNERIRTSVLLAEIYGGVKGL